MVSSKKKKKNGVFKKKKKNKKKKNGVFKKKKKKWCLPKKKKMVSSKKKKMVSSKKKRKKKRIIWVGIQHVRDYRAQGETAGASVLARVYSQLFYDSVDMTGYFFYFFVFCIIFFIFEDTIDKFRLLISKIYTQLTWNLPETYPKFTRNLPDHLA